MGFRNPVTSLSADQITPGTLGGSVIAQQLRTAATGRRIVATTGPDSGRLAFYDGGEPEGYATLDVVPYGGVSGRSMITLDNHSGSSLTLKPEEIPAGGWLDVAELTADETRITGALTVAGRLDSPNTPGPTEHLEATMSANVANAVMSNLGIPTKDPGRSFGQQTTYLWTDGPGFTAGRDGVYGLTLAAAIGGGTVSGRSFIQVETTTGALYRVAFTGDDRTVVAIPNLFLRTTT